MVHYGFHLHFPNNYPYWTFSPRYLLAVWINFSLFLVVKFLLYSVLIPYRVNLQNIFFSCPLVISPLCWMFPLVYKNCSVWCNAICQSLLLLPRPMSWNISKCFLLVRSQSKILHLSLCILIVLCVCVCVVSSKNTQSILHSEDWTLLIVSSCRLCWRLVAGGVSILLTFKSNLWSLHLFLCQYHAVLVSLVGNIF